MLGVVTGHPIDASISWASKGTSGASRAPLRRPTLAIRSTPRSVGRPGARRGPAGLHFGAERHYRHLCMRPSTPGLKGVVRRAGCASVLRVRASSQRGESGRGGGQMGLSFPGGGASSANLSAETARAVEQGRGRGNQRTPDLNVGSTRSRGQGRHDPRQPGRSPAERNRSIQGGSCQRSG